MKKFLKILFLSLGLFVLQLLSDGKAFAVSTPWSTSFDCSDWTDPAAWTSCDSMNLYNAGYAVGGHYSSRTAVSNNPLGTGKGFRMWHGAVSNSHTSRPVVDVSTSSSEIWIRIYQRWQSGTRFGSGYIKQLYFNESLGYPNTILLEVDGGGIRYLDPGTALANFRAGGWNDFYPGGVSDGSWHCFEYYFKAGSNGTFSYWVDGVLKGTATGIRVPQITGGLSWRVNNSGFTATEWEDMDDIAISTTGYIGPIGGGGGGGGDTTAPTIPTNLAATPVSSSQINLTWTASTDSTGVAGYSVYRNGSLIGTSATNSYSSTGLSASTGYSYRVSAYDVARNTSAQSLSVTATTQAASQQATLMFDGFENRNIQANWGADWRAGGETYPTSPVHGGTYSLAIPSTNVGSYVHAYGDNPLGGAGVDGVLRDDITVDHWYYLPADFSYPPVELKIWISNSFHNWGAYPTSQAQGKPNSYAPYYMTIALLGSSHGANAGTFYGELTRADGLGAPSDIGSLWQMYAQNQGTPAKATLGQWNHLRFRTKLNTVGQSDGIFQMWVNDVLKADYSNVNYRSSYTAHGWNHLMLVPHFNNSVPKAENVYYDDVYLYSGGSTVTPKTPSVPGSVFVN